MGANADLVRRWFREVWTEPRNAATVDELMSHDCQLNGVNASGPTSREDFKKLRDFIISSYPDIRIEATEIKEFPDGAAFYAQVTGTHAETSKPVKFGGTGFAKVEQGKICTSYETWDFLGMMEQIGAVDRAAVARELFGAPIETHRQVLETWFRRVWSEADVTAIDEMFPSDGKASGLGAQLRVGPEAFKDFHAQFLSLLTDIKIEVDHSMESGDWLSALFMLTAKSRATGTPVEMSGTCIAQIIDGKIIEAYNHLDFMGLYQQLGLMPDGSFERCLCGEKIS